jgi:hypothetical protein
MSTITLQQISDLLDQKLEVKLEEKLTEKLSPMYSELKQLKKTQNILLKMLDREQMSQRVRLDIIEKKLHIPH